MGSSIFKVFESACPLSKGLKYSHSACGSVLTFLLFVWDVYLISGAMVSHPQSRRAASFYAT